MKSTLILTIASLLVGHQIARSQEVEWSETQKKEGYYTTIYPVSGKTFFTSSWTGMTAKKFNLQYHQDFMITASERVDFEANGSKARFENVKMINNKPYVFLSDHQEGVNVLYYQEYGTDCVASGELTELASFSFPKGTRNRGDFSILQSDNKEFFVVISDMPSSGSENDKFGYKIFTKEFKLVKEGEYESPYPVKESDFTFTKLSDFGDLFFGMKVYNTNERGKVKDHTNLKEYLIFLVNENELKQGRIDLGDRLVSDLYFTIDKNRLLSCTGLYGTRVNKVSGAFYLQFDFDTQRQLNEGYYEFTKEFITQDFSNRQKKKADKREAKGKGSPQLYSYDFLNVQPLEDGGILAMIEQYYVVVVTRTDPKTGATSTTYHYYYNDIIAYKVDAKGTFSWVTKIDKLQHSVNDGGYCSSAKGYVKGNTSTWFFNDNVKNYDEASAEFVGNPKNKGLALPSTISKKGNCVAKVELDMETGNMKRTRFTSRSELDVIAVPKYFKVDYINSEMFMYFQTRKEEKFGLLKF